MLLELLGLFFCHLALTLMAHTQTHTHKGPHTHARQRHVCRLYSVYGRKSLVFEELRHQAWSEWERRPSSEAPRVIQGTLSRQADGGQQPCREITHGPGGWWCFGLGLRKETRMFWFSKLEKITHAKRKKGIKKPQKTVACLQRNNL